MKTLAHVAIDPLPGDWREQLVTRLGQRPRRLGAWTELALFGALRCLDEAGESALPAGVHLRVASLNGPRDATWAIVEQGHGTGVPMPFSFMQSQPSQLLAALSLHLGWSGDARFTVTRDRDTLLRMALRECGPAGVLIGWVEENQSTEWWRLGA